ncbi:hypothetical protein EDD86DRAFT_198611 [Gorgonomyces haynaldii]|nr:hypothetical protein EDD86DRAFT_198611 [Gorgonomyces haynaldii]
MRSCYKRLKMQPYLKGFWSGLFLLIDDSVSRRKSIGLTLLSKAPLFGWRALVQKQMGPVLSFVDAQGVKGMWLLVAYLVCYTCFNIPEHVPRSYYKSLLYVTGIINVYQKDTDRVMKAHSELVNYSTSNQIDLSIPESTTSRDYLLKMFQDSRIGDIVKRMVRLDLIPSGARHSQLACCWQHPLDASCESGALRYAFGVVRQVLPLYIAINSVSTIVSLYNKKAKKRKILRDYVHSTLRTGLMMGSFVGLFSYIVCRFRRFFGRDLGFIYGLGGLLAVPTLFIEKQSRLIDLLGYCSTKVLETGYGYGKLHHLVPDIKYGELLFLLPSIAIVAECVENHPETVHGMMKPLLFWLFQK